MRSSVLLAVAACLAATSHSGASTAFVDVNSPRQIIDGFGGSSAWSPALTDAQADTLFGNGNNQQLGLTLLRARIDPGNAWSAETTNAQKAHARGAKVIGTAWTPPASMKTNNNTVGGELSTSQYGNYVNWLNSAATSIGLDYVSVQNEPDITVTYESCTWSPTQFANFFLYNAQNLNRPAVMPESFHFDDNYANPTLSNPTAASRVAIVGGHIYGAGLTTHQTALNAGKRVWMTEHYVDGTDIGSCMSIAKEVTDCMANSMSAYLWWWMYYPGNSSDIMNGSTPLKNGFVIAQFSKFVRPGSVRVDATYNPSTNVYVTGYKDGSGKVTIVAVNVGTSSVSQPFSISNGNASSLNAYRTSGSENLASVGSMSVSGGAFTATLPAQSVTTFVQAGTTGGGTGLANGTYRIVCLNGGKVLDVVGFGTANGTNVDQWTNNGGSNQKWIVTKLSNGNYSIISVSANKSLDGANAGTTNGTNVQIWTYGGGANQQWILTPATNGYYRISPSNAPGLALDVSNASTADGANVQLYSYWGGSNEQWSFQP